MARSGFGKSAAVLVVVISVLVWNLPGSELQGQDLELANLPMDRSTASCLGCHFGQMFKVIHVEDDRFSLTYLQDETGHPIGMEYEDAVRRSRFSQAFVPVQALNRAISLPEGRIGCISCHEEYIPPVEGAVESHGQLVVSRTLCIECHRF